MTAYMIFIKKRSYISLETPLSVTLNDP